MNDQTEPKSWWQGTTAFCILATLFVALLVYIALVEFPKGVRHAEAIRILAAEKKAGGQKKQQEAKMGYPAPESEISAGKYYSCDVLVTDRWGGHTNNYVLLMEVVQDGQFWRAKPESRRFFRIKKVLPDRKVYLACRTNGVLFFQGVGPVVPTTN